MLETAFLEHLRNRRRACPHPLEFRVSDAMAEATAGRSLSQGRQWRRGSTLFVG